MSAGNPLSVTVRLLGLALCAEIFSLTGWAADGAAADTKSAPAKTATKKPADPYAVPDGTPDEINEFIDKLRSERKAFATRLDAIDHAIKVQRAIIEAGDKILALKVDDTTAYAAAEMKLEALELLASAGIDGAMEEAVSVAKEMSKHKNAEVAELAKELITRLRISGACDLEPEDRRKLIDEILSDVQTSRFARPSLSAAVQLGEALEAHSDQSVPADYYVELANLLKKSAKPGILELAEVLEANARRLKLPGNPIEVKGKTLTGEKFDWSKYKGKVVLVDFWATWCGPCVEEVPNVKANYERYHSKGFEVVGISLDEDKQALTTFLKSEEIPWTTLFAEEGNQPSAQYYGITSIPTAILVDREGKVVSLEARGEALTELLESMFAMLTDSK